MKHHHFPPRARAARAALQILFSFGVAAGLGFAPIAASAQAPNEGENAAPSAEDRGNAACLECHADADAIENRRYVVDPADFKVGPHAENEVQCIDCHVQAAKVADITDHGKLGPARCDGCHEDAVEHMTQGAHAPSRVTKRPTPTCASCHGVHRILPSSDPASPVAPAQQAVTCGKCHSPTVIGTFVESVHGRALAKLVKGADAAKQAPPSCSSCHGPHLVEFGDILRNPRFKLAMVKNCSGCHPKAAEEYAISVHGTALLQRQRFESASCVDCHRGHEIYRPTDPRSAVFATEVQQDCSKCHADATLIRRFGLPDQVVESYALSYHGLASREGDARVANCATCHEYHAIFPQSDPRSSVHPSNLQNTCGKCHQGASANFIEGKIHVTIGSEDHQATWVVKAIYTWMIIMVVGGMLIHNMLDFFRKMRLRAREQAAQPCVIRMNRVERISHAFMFTSFIVLAYTGFALVYPDQWWTAPLDWVSKRESFRSLLHRVAGVGLIGIGFFHLWWLAFTRRGREQLGHLAPRLNDVRQLRENFLFLIGRRAEPPYFGRLSYIEKAEYWALIWGSVIMGITGIVLWFEVAATQLMPLWVYHIFEAVHFYEAVLAVLAVVVWHFYYVFINPEDAPMSLTWLTGKVTLEHLKHHRPAEYDALQQNPQGVLPPETAAAELPERHPPK